MQMNIVKQHMWDEKPKGVSYGEAINVTNAYVTMATQIGSLTCLEE